MKKFNIQNSDSIEEFKTGIKITWGDQVYYVNNITFDDVLEYLELEEVDFSIKSFGITWKIIINK